jgi:hypothetical protein
MYLRSRLLIIRIVYRETKHLQAFPTALFSTKKKNRRRFGICFCCCLGWMIVDN